MIPKEAQAGRTVRATQAFRIFGTISAPVDPAGIHRGGKLVKQGTMGEITGKVTMWYGKQYVLCRFFGYDVNVRLDYLELA